ncbi:MAG: hypothetical protein Q8R74_04560 [Methylophilus sp.]|nr:hypothetical protein [Methylophilus sp.]
MKDMNLTYAGLLIGLALVMLFVFLKSKSQGGSSADPLAEAEVYLAYGRKKQAIEILEKAKLEYPNRTDIQAKLDELRIKP